ncbi:oligoendopeptidase F, partial [Thermodesulfobacteriota bacterium]
LDGYAGFKDRLHESAEVLKALIEFDLSVSRELEKLYTFAHLKNDEDQSDQEYLGMYQRAVSLYTRHSEISSFIHPEIMSIDEELIQTFLNDESLQEYRLMLEKILRSRPHTLDGPMEELIAMTIEMAQAPRQVFSQLDNVDLKFGSIKDISGNEIELSHGNFSTFLINPERDIRKTAFHQYYKVYDEHKNSIAAALAGSLKSDIFYSRSRRFDSCREQALFPDKVPGAVYDNLVETVRSNLNPLFKYLDFRKNALDLDNLHFYDTYVPILSEVDIKTPYDQAVEHCLKSLSPLGHKYIDILKDGLSKGWVDRYENRGKRSGAYSSGCYDSPPYILLNYEDENINSLYTLAHEAGHSMHSYLSRENQPYVYHDYTIFVAEVASTFNEALLSRYLLKEYKDNPRMKAYIINREIDNIRGTLFRQTMFAEFEHQIHLKAERNEPLTLDAMTNLYESLLKAYFGDHMVIDDVLQLECLRIPHFYSAFYVYKYATGISAAIALAQKVMSEGDSARNAYLSFLKLGSSKYPLDELKDAGVDMTSPEPIKAAIRYFEGLVVSLEEIYKQI